MNQNLIIVTIGVLILIGAGVLFFVKKPEPVAQNTQAEQQQQSTSTPQGSAATSTPEEGGDGEAPVATVSFTADGYSPATVTIQKGAAVRFVNATADMETWPASANHPTHTVYPQKSADDCLGSAFDACRGLKAGESWEFTFTEVGSWAYHDHMHANRRGTVVVTE